MKTLLNNADYKNGDDDQRKEMVGDEIYEFVEGIVGEDEAPKVTGMIIDLPQKDLMAILNNYSAFNNKVQEGMKLIKQSSAQQWGEGGIQFPNVLCWKTKLLNKSIFKTILSWGRLG